MTEDRLQAMDKENNALSLGAFKTSFQEPGKGKKWGWPRLKKKQILIFLALLFLAGTLAGIGVFLLKKEAPEEPIAGTSSTSQEGTSASSQKSDESDIKQAIVFEDIVALAPFERIRLNETSDMKLLSLDISLEIADPRYRQQVASMENRIREIVQDQIKEKSWLELRNAEGKIQLKYELLAQINAVFSQVMVRNLYFTNFLMQ